MSNYLLSFDTPQLKKLHSGKVRDSFRIDDETRMIVVTDRLSAFDSVLKTPIAYKGAVLNGISNWWFSQTQDIVANHFVKAIDPNITLVREAVPLKVEVVVRGYLTGSMWRAYQRGERIISGVAVRDGMVKNQQFDTPILTPSTKEKNDRPVSRDEVMAMGLVEKKAYEKIEAIALRLFDKGTKHLASKGIILVDTKYEFGMIGEEVILIDEIHTPDSSRFWSAEDYAAKPATAAQIDKEYIRQWLLANEKDGQKPRRLSDEVAEEASKRYRQMYETITGQAFAISDLPVNERMNANLVAAGVIEG